MDKKLVQVITGISPNTLRMCSRNHCLKMIRTKKTRAFWFSSSKIKPRSDHSTKDINWNQPAHGTSRTASQGKTPSRWTHPEPGKVRLWAHVRTVNTPWTRKSETLGSRARTGRLQSMLSAHRDNESFTRQPDRTWKSAVWWHRN
jgi:hypothetical protein